MRNSTFVIAVIALTQLGLWPIWGALTARAQDPSAVASAPRTLTRIGQIRQLTAEQANLGYPAKLTATVTYAEPSRLLYIQDETGEFLSRPSPRRRSGNTDGGSR